MAPKATAAKAGARAAPAKPAPPQAAPVTDLAQGTKRKAEMDGKLYKSLLNRFNYQIKQPDGHEAREAKTMFMGLSEELKVAFVTQWDKESRSSGGKAGWRWTNTFIKTYTSQTKVESGQNSNFLFAGKILEHAGLRISDFPNEDAWLEVVHKLVLQNKETHGHAGEVVHHPDARLRKWYWIQDDGVSTTASSSTAESATRTATVADSAMAQAFGGNENQPGPVKAESPQFVELQSSLANLGSLVGQLQRQMALSESLGARSPLPARGAR